MENSRFGLVYRFPSSFNAVYSDSLTKSSHYSLSTLEDLLAQPYSEPRLEAKFRLAFNLTNTVFDLHARGVSHGNLLPSNVSFAATKSELDNDWDLRRPLISSFNVFPAESSDSVDDLSCKPADFHSIKDSSFTESTDNRVLELYSLATILLSIGLWLPLDNLTQDVPAKALPEHLLEQLALKCGTLYMKAVQSCWLAVDSGKMSDMEGESVLSSVQMRATRFLEACCILDGVSGLEERVTQDFQEVHVAARKEPATTQNLGNPLKDMRDVKSSDFFSSQSSKPAVLPEPEMRKPSVKNDACDLDVEGEDPLLLDLRKSDNC